MNSSWARIGRGFERVEARGFIGDSNLPRAADRFNSGTTGLSKSMRICVDIGILREYFIIVLVFLFRGGQFREEIECQV